MTDDEKIDAIIARILPHESAQQGVRALIDIAIESAIAAVHDPADGCVAAMSGD